MKDDEYEDETVLGVLPSLVMVLGMMPGMVQKAEAANIDVGTIWYCGASVQNADLCGFFL